MWKLAEPEDQSHKVGPPLSLRGSSSSRGIDAAFISAYPGGSAGEERRPHSYGPLMDVGVRRFLVVL